MIPAQLVALLASISYALSSISARRGMRYSNPATVTCFSLTIHTVTIWTAVFLSGGIPDVAPIAVILFIVAGVLQPVIRLFTYTGIYKVGASRSGTLRSTNPLFSTVIAILFLNEEASIATLAGTISVVLGIVVISWQREEQPAIFRWWYLLFPLIAALLAGVNHPLRRYALSISNYPLFFTAVVGIVSLTSFSGYLAFPSPTPRLVWHRKALGPFLLAGFLETLGIFLVITALSLGRVVVVSPIVATSPMWVLVGTAIFLRGIERVSARTVLGTLCVVGGTVAISLAG